MTATGILSQPSGPGGALEQPMTPGATFGTVPAPVVHSGTAQGAFLDSLTLAAAANAAADYYRWMRVRITGGTGAGQERAILASGNNLMPDSESVASWANAGVNVTADAVISPRGDATADLMIATNNETNRHTRYQLIAVGDMAANYSFTVFGRHHDGAVYLTAYVAGGNYQGGNRCGRGFDLTNGVMGGGVNAQGTAVLLSSIMEDAGGGFWKCSIKANLNVVGAGNIAVAIAVDSTLDSGNIGSSWLGNGTSGFSAWGAHFNAGAKPPTYYPTPYASGAVGIQVDRPWLVLPDATSTYEIIHPGSAAVGVLSQP